MPEMADAEVMSAFNDQAEGYKPGRLNVRFFEDVEPDNDKPGSFKACTFIEIQIPGNVRETRCRPVRVGDKREHAREWADYQNNRISRPNGTPLDQVPFMNKARVLELQAKGLWTAEQVRDMSDDIAQQFMGIRADQQKLKDYLANRDKAQPILAMRAELESRDAEIAAMKLQLADLAQAAAKAKVK